MLLPIFPTTLCLNIKHWYRHPLFCVTLLLSRKQRLTLSAIETHALVTQTGLRSIYTYIHTATHTSSHCNTRTGYSNSAPLNIFSTLTIRLPVHYTARYRFGRWEFSPIGIFAEQKFRWTEISPNGNFAKGNFRRKFPQSLVYRFDVKWDENQQSVNKELVRNTNKI